MMCSINIGIKRVLDEISKLEMQCFDGLGLAENLLASRSSLMAELESLLRYEEVLWKQNAKYKWIKEGDEITRFFIKLLTEGK